MIRDLQIFIFFRVVLIFFFFGGCGVGGGRPPQSSSGSTTTLYPINIYICRVFNTARVCGDITNFTLKKKLTNDIEMNVINDTLIR